MAFGITVTINFSETGNEMKKQENTMECEGDVGGRGRMNQVRPVSGGTSAGADSVPVAFPTEA